MDGQLRVHVSNLSVLWHNGAPSYGLPSVTTLDQLIAQAQKLNQQISELRKSERSRAIAEIHQIMATHGLTAQDLSEASKSSKTSGLTGKPVAAKFADGNGNSWSGRGLKPRWLTAALNDGKKLEDFAV